MLAIFFIVVLAFLADALLVLCPTELQAARQNKFRSQAYYCAEAGIVEAITYIESQFAANNPVGSIDINLNQMGGFYTKVKIISDATNAYNLTAVYHLVSGVYQSAGARSSDTSSECREAVQTINTFILQDSFSKFAYYSNNEGSCVWREGYQIDGPFHSNDAVAVDISSNYERDASSLPMFLGETSFPSITNNGSQVSSGQLDKLLNYNPLSGFKEINLPLNTVNLKELVWDPSRSSFPTSQGVYVQTNSGDLANKGIYIHGNVDAMSMSGGYTLVKQGIYGYYIYSTVNSSGKPLSVAIKKGIVNASGALQSVISTNIYAGLGSGLGKQVIYCDGNINNLSGVNLGQKIIAADLETNKAITISGDIFRADTSHYADYTNYPLSYLSKPTGSRDALGLIAENILIKDDPSYQTYWNNYGDCSTTWNHPMFNVDIFAILMSGKKVSTTSASGGFGVENPGTRPPAGYINIYGGLIQGTRGAVGTIGHGFRRRVFYDSYSAKALNGFFPTLPKFHIIGWQASSNIGSNVHY